MNRITQLFEKKKERILSIYFTAGYPALEDTFATLQALEKYGADMIEIGIPFSDPVADGPIIQQSSDVALQNGMTLEILFQQLSKIREKVQIPLILMGYFNPVLQYGVKRFIEKCSSIGIDGVILPDLPLDVYETKYKRDFEEAGLSNIFLITPQTSEERIRHIDALSSGFIYMVSTSSTTGGKTGITAEMCDYFDRTRDLKLKSPLLVGFGISDKNSFDRICQHVNGGIIGTAFIKALSGSESVDEKVRNFVSTLL